MMPENNESPFFKSKKGAVPLAQKLARSEGGGEGWGGFYTHAGPFAGLLPTLQGHKMSDKSNKIQLISWFGWGQYINDGPLGKIDLEL